MDFANEVKQSFMAFRKAYDSTSSIEHLIYKSYTIFYIDNNFAILSDFFLLTDLKTYIFAIIFYTLTHTLYFGM